MPRRLNTLLSSIKQSPDFINQVSYPLSIAFPHQSAAVFKSSLSKNTALMPSLCLTDYPHLGGTVKGSDNCRVQFNISQAPTLCQTPRWELATEGKVRCNPDIIEQVRLQQWPLCSHIPVSTLFGSVPKQ